MFLIAGPCVIESEEMVFEIASKMNALTQELGVEYIFKASFDKANRSSTGSYRRPGIDEGLRILAAVKKEFGFRVLTDVHEDTPIDEVASVVDVLQTPAFLVRQTNFIQKVARAGLPVNIKKGQFQALGIWSRWPVNVMKLVIKTFGFVTVVRHLVITRWFLICVAYR
jgi:2-dehydro-3-deoxyphosphooctonate aldolase (KDO 8-P synthase)